MSFRITVSVGTSVRIDREFNLDGAKNPSDKELAGFCMFLGTFLKEGVPILQALELASKVVRNQRLAAFSCNAIKVVSEGEYLSAAFRHPEENSQLLPSPILKAMCEFGENTGTLDSCLHALSQYFFIVQRARVFPESVLQDLVPDLQDLECELLAFFVTYGAGMPIVPALQVVSEEFPASVWGELAVAVKAGKLLSEALLQKAGTFGPGFIALVRAAESGGQLDQLCRGFVEMADQGKATPY